MYQEVSQSGTSGERIGDLAWTAARTAAEPPGDAPAYGWMTPRLEMASSAPVPAEDTGGDSRDEPVLGTPELTERESVAEVTAWDVTVTSDDSVTVRLDEMPPGWPEGVALPTEITYQDHDNGDGTTTRTLRIMSGAELTGDVGDGRVWGVSMSMSAGTYVETTVTAPSESLPGRSEWPFPSLDPAEWEPGTTMKVTSGTEAATGEDYNFRGVVVGSTGTSRDFNTLEMSNLGDGVVEVSMYDGASDDDTTRIGVGVRDVNATVGSTSTVEATSGQTIRIDTTAPGGQETLDTLMETGQMPDADSPGVVVLVDRETVYAASAPSVALKVFEVDVSAEGEWSQAEITTDTYVNPDGTTTQRQTLVTQRGEVTMTMTATTDATGEITPVSTAYQIESVDEPAAELLSQTYDQPVPVGSTVVIEVSDPEMQSLLDTEWSQANPGDDAAVGTGIKDHFGLGQTEKPSTSEFAVTVNRTCAGDASTCVYTVVGELQDPHSDSVEPVGTITVIPASEDGEP